MHTALFSHQAVLRQPSRLCLAIAAVLAAGTTAAAEAPTTERAAQFSPQAELNGEGSLYYVGDGTRISIGYDRRDHARAEIYHVFSESERSAWIGEAWMARDAGGLKFSYHWLPENFGEGSAVGKVFAAVDENQFSDRKASLGFGLENEQGFAAVYLSKALTDARLLDTRTARSTEIVEGMEGDRPYRNTITTTTFTHTFEQAYDEGIGARIGTFFNDSLLRLTGGLDHERGEQGASQNTLSVELEKFFNNSPHSFSLRLENWRKDGALEPVRDDTRAQFMYRYEFGGRGAGRNFIGSFRPQTLHRQVEVRSPALPEERWTEKTEHRIVKTTVNMASGAFFELNKSVLTEAAQQELNRILQTLNTQGYEGNIRISGHTCDLGSDAYNLKLSQRRADAVRAWLVAHGVDAERILSEGKGERAPKFPNSKTERHQNRRVELEFVSYENRTEDVKVKVPVENVTKLDAPVQWQREVVDQEPAWVRRALHNTVRHKTTVDVYRTQKQVNHVNVQREYLNRAPVATADSFSMMSGKESRFDILANDRDPDGDSLSVVSLSLVAPSNFSPQFGDARLVDNQLVLNVVRNFSGPVSYRYQLRDAKGKTTEAVVTVTVALSNVAPVASNDEAQTTIGTPVVVDVLANDRDADLDSFTLTSLQQPVHGSAEIVSGKIRYTPAAGFSGEDEVLYTITDAYNATAQARLKISVAGQANKAPIAKDDFRLVSGQVPSELDVLVNDSDPDNDALSIVSVTQPVDGHGTVSIVGNKILFQPKAPFKTDQFTYTISDGRGGSATATVFLEDP